MKKIFTYEELRMLDVLPDFKSISELQIKQLYLKDFKSPQEIANLFSVTKYRVLKKLSEYNLSHKDVLAESFIQSNLFNSENAKSEKRLSQENISNLSKAITHYAFRNGPVEDMHAEGKLSEDDMMILNKYMVNRIATLLTYMKNDKWAWIENLYGFYIMFGTHWDEPELDEEEFEFMMRHNIKKIIK